MKKLFLTLLSLIWFNSYSQSRINIEKDLVIWEFQSWIIGDSISGWDLDKGEEWKERKGYLRVGSEVGFMDIYERNDGIKRNKDILKSRTKQNFNEWGVIKVTYKGEEYVGFGIETVNGRYEYPAIKRDWYTFINYNIFIFNKEELEKLNKLEGEVELNVWLGTYDDPLHKDKKYQSCYDNLLFLFKNGDTDKEIFKFKKTESDGVNVVRFLNSQKISRYGEKPIDFEKHYFEINIEKFNELLSLIRKEQANFFSN